MFDSFDTTSIFLYLLHSKAIRFCFSIHNKLDKFIESFSIYNELIERHLSFFLYFLVVSFFISIIVHLFLGFKNIFRDYVDFNGLYYGFLFSFLVICLYLIAGFSITSFIETSCILIPESTFDYVLNFFIHHNRFSEINSLKPFLSYVL